MTHDLAKRLLGSGLVVALAVGFVPANVRAEPTPAPGAAATASPPPTIGVVKVKAYDITPDSVARLNIVWTNLLAKNSKFGAEIWNALISDAGLGRSWTLSAESKSKIDALLREKSYDAMTISFALRTRAEPNGPVDGTGGQGSVVDPNTGVRGNSVPAGAVSDPLGQNQAKGAYASAELRIIMTGWKRGVPEEIARLSMSPDQILSAPQSKILTDERWKNDKGIVDIGIVYTYDRSGKAIACNVLILNEMTWTQLSFQAGNRDDTLMTREKRVAVLLAKPNKGLVLSKYQNIPPGFTDDYIVLEPSADSVLLGANSVVLFNLQNLINASRGARDLDPGIGVPPEGASPSPSPTPTPQPTHPPNMIRRRR